MREIVERVRAEQQDVLRPKLDKERRRREKSERESVLATAYNSNLESSVAKGLDRLAGLATGVVYGAVCLAPVLGGIWLLPIEWSESVRSHEIWAIAWWVCVATFLGCSMAALFTRRLQMFNVFDRLKGWFKRLFQAHLFPELEDGEEPE